MLMVFATSRADAAATRRGLGNFRRRAPASPRPVTIPMRAHVICTAAIRGHVRKAVQRSDVPNRAPAIE
jgi:hypothetical protein